MRFWRTALEVIEGTGADLSGIARQPCWCGVTGPHIRGRVHPPTECSMPNQPRKDNPARTIRVSDDLWQRAQERAAERDESVSDVVRKALERYIKRR